MGDTKDSALPAATSVAATDLFAFVQGGSSKSVLATLIRSYVGTGLNDASTAAVPAAYAADTYLAGSSVPIPTTGSWVAGTMYTCGFDMVKTAAGTAAFTIIVRLGATATTADAAILTLAYAVGTAAVDTGWFTVNVTFRSVGSGTSAVIQGTTTCAHHLAATGLITTGASGTGIILGTSAGFNSTTSSIIGISVNGGASFSGTNTMVQAAAQKI